MTKFTQYKIMQTNSINSLESKIEESIKNGWQPLGGISVSEQKLEYSDNRVEFKTFFLQAIVK